MPGVPCQIAMPAKQFRTKSCQRSRLNFVIICTVLSIPFLRSSDRSQEIDEGEDDAHPVQRRQDQQDPDHTSTAR